MCVTNTTEKTKDIMFVTNTTQKTKDIMFVTNTTQKTKDIMCVTNTTQKTKIKCLSRTLHRKLRYNVCHVHYTEN